ncbi:hypothetical protein B0T25DRAFT_520895 [Lasiosphaeria hispida]|uniref:Uncharacterized protein n=1 Tax=Lasiosphaeria hispida TaxID=260671 RepID=A0AAJ0HBD4_9PEZI|nr:hypothetical protein B0T25DRAFT_520895 [Lasiosphaeria hispida]
MAISGMDLMPTIEAVISIMTDDDFEPLDMSLIGSEPNHIKQRQWLGLIPLTNYTVSAALPHWRGAVSPGLRRSRPRPRSAKSAAPQRGGLVEDGCPPSVGGREIEAICNSNTLGLPIDHIVIYSLAQTSDRWEIPPSRVATLQASVPVPLRGAEAVAKDEWQIPIPGGAPNETLILDTHFKGMTMLSEEPEQHLVDCIAISDLASHPFVSWQPRGNDKTFMWIRDEISKSIPGARPSMGTIQSFKPNGPGSFQSISDIARSLI